MPDRVETLLKFLKNTPEDSFLQHALALEYIKTGNDKEAAKVFEKLLEKDPGYIGSYYHLAKVLERLKERSRAIEVYEKGMEMAKKAGDGHTFNELQAAYEDLIY